MDQEAVSPGHGGVGRDVKVALAFLASFEMVDPERVRREQAVVSYVPPGRVPGVRRMIKDGDPDRFSSDGTVVVDPIRSLPPGLISGEPVAVDDLPLCHFSLESHRWRQTDGHRSFFGVPQGEIAVRGMHGDFKIEHPFGAGAIVDGDGSCIRPDNGPVLGHQFIE